MWLYKVTKVRVSVPLMFLDKQKTLPTNQFQTDISWYLFPSPVTQVLSNVLAVVPWVIDFIVDSGWAQEIVRSGVRRLSGQESGDCQVRSQEVVKSAEWPF